MQYAIILRVYLANFGKVVSPFYIILISCWTLGTELLGNYLPLKNLSKHTYSKK